MKTKLALFGAAGKMGTRISKRLRNRPEYQTMYVEAGEAALAALRQNGLEPVDPHSAASEADVIVLAVPDKLIGKLSKEIVPLMKSRAMMILLDPAAPYGGELPVREDITYFVTHPCHPPVVNDETDPEARMDFFGAIKAKQHAVAALMQGPEEDFSRGEAIVRSIFPQL